MILCCRIFIQIYLKYQANAACYVELKHETLQFMNETQVQT